MKDIKDTCVIESPYAGDIARNMVYLERCIRWCAENGWAPYASHKMMTDALDDHKPDERILGLQCGYAFRRLVGQRIFFIDYGYSHGMQLAAKLYFDEGLSSIEQSIGVNP